MSGNIIALTTALPAAAWTQDADIIAPHLVEWRDKYHGQTPLMLTPRSTAEVARAVKLCAEHGLKIVPQGGNTGLTPPMSQTANSRFSSPPKVLALLAGIFRPMRAVIMC